jgi:2-isopropylmalate synthase
MALSPSAPAVAGEDLQELVELALLLGGLAALDGVGNARLDVRAQHGFRRLTERRLGRGDLEQHVDAVAIVFDHARHPLDLPRDAAKALEDLIFGRSVQHDLMPYGGIGLYALARARRQAPSFAGSPARAPRATLPAMSSSQPRSGLIHDWNAPEGELVASRTPALLDDTLRDGLQNAAVRTPSLDEKSELLRLMAAIGVECVNLGLPGSSSQAFEDARRLCGVIASERLPLRVAVAGRTLEGDMRAIVELAQATGMALEGHAFVGSSDIRWFAEGWELARVRTMSEDALAVLRRAGLAATFVTEDTTRSRPAVLHELFAMALDSGAARLCLCDTVGHATPEGVRRLVGFTRSLLAERAPSTAVDWHGHNDRGLALANTLAALDAGVQRAHATALGIGERVGNVPMELLVMNLVLAGRLAVEPKLVARYAERAAAAVRFRVPANHPLVGENAFRTATGVHAAAIAKARKKSDWVADRVYSAVPAAPLGRAHEIFVGAMSGASNVVAWLGRHGIAPSDALVAGILARARASERVLSDAEILEVVERSKA